MIPSDYIFYYLIGINIFTFVIFGADKWMASSGGWRTSEKRLWLCALLGGSIGALAAMHFFRHKTRKTSFQLVLAVIVFLQAAALYIFFYGI